MSEVRSSEGVDLGPQRGTGKLVLAAAMAQRVLELEALVNRQAGEIADLTERLAEAGARLGGYWQNLALEEMGLAEPVRHRNCRGRFGR